MTKIIDKVLCALVPQPVLQEIEEQDLWMDLEDYSIKHNRFYYKIIPLINHPHSDKENGQKEVHYHADTRYNGNQELRIKLENQIEIVKWIEKNS